MAPSACGGINNSFAVVCVVLWFVFLFVFPSEFFKKLSRLPSRIFTRRLTSCSNVHFSGIM